MKKGLTEALAWAGIMLGLAAAAVAAQRMGYVDHVTATRLTTGIFGIWMVWYGNRIPKTFAPSECVRRVQKVSAWSMILSGFTYAILWAFAPVPIALSAGMAVILTSIVVTLGYCVSLHVRRKAG
ncbi:MAG TPA: ammonium transporter [Sphingomicrobium sp.]|nr:ammonium transporter [Sphingomicrobium sp.]